MTSAINQNLETRDFLQHKIVAEFYSSVLTEHLIFKGGTMLRVCGFPQYRYSEDLDFDIIGISMSDCYSIIQRILTDISSEIGKLTTKLSRQKRYSTECLPNAIVF